MSTTGTDRNKSQMLHAYTSAILDRYLVHNLPAEDSAHCCKASIFKLCQKSGFLTVLSDAQPCRQLPLHKPLAHCRQHARQSLALGLDELFLFQSQRKSQHPVLTLLPRLLMTSWETLPPAGANKASERHQMSQSTRAPNAAEPGNAPAPSPSRLHRPCILRGNREPFANTAEHQQKHSLGAPAAPRRSCFCTWHRKARVIPVSSLTTS